jgi:anti-anti-sigma regulatory factor
MPMTRTLAILPWLVPSFLGDTHVMRCSASHSPGASTGGTVAEQEAEYQKRFQAVIPGWRLTRGESAMNQATTILEIGQENEMLVLEPIVELYDLDELELEGAVHELLERMDHSGVMDVFLDLHRTDVLDSQALRLAVELWKQVRSHGGSLAICLI